MFLNYNYLKTIYNIFIDMKASGAIRAGGRRIKQKRKRTTAPVVDDVHGDYIDAVAELNEKLANMKDNEYIKFRDFSTRLVEELSNELKRAYFKDRNEFKVFKGDDNNSSDRLKYLFTKLFKPINEVKIIMNADNIQFIKKTFTIQGIYLLKQMVMSLQNCITNRTYVQEDPEKQYNKEKFIENCNVLEISDTDKKIPFSLVKENYEKVKESVKDDVEKSLEVTNAFISVRNQYDNYIKSFDA